MILISHDFPLLRKTLAQSEIDYVRQVMMKVEESIGHECAIDDIETKVQQYCGNVQCG